MGFEFRVWPAVFYSLLVFCKKPNKNRWFIGSEVTPSRLFFSTFDLQKGQALPGPP
jgi:hypothetical protein